MTGMMIKRRILPRIITAASAACLVLSVFHAKACTQPVFRYALERWPAAQYRLTVLHKGPVDEELRAGLNSLCPEQTTDLAFIYVDIDGELPHSLAATNWLANPDSSRLPLGLLEMPPDVYYPQAVLWEGKVDGPGVVELKRLLYSPVVCGLIRSICAGDTAAWLLIRGPDEAENQELRSLLEQTLRIVKKDLVLPHELDEEDTVYDSDPAPGIPMKLEFSVIEADLNSPEETLLKNCLTALGPEFMATPGALVVPVFSRGRALAIFKPDELNEDLLKEVCGFLAGPCSCRIKSMNPGFDLLMPFPWDRILWDETASVGKLIAEIAPPAAEPSAELQNEDADGERTLSVRYGAAIVVLIVLLSAWRFGKRTGR